ncbi:MAG: gamma-glutamyltransferase family protein [Pseudomonadota bacterium]
MFSFASIAGCARTAPPAVDRVASEGRTASVPVVTAANPLAVDAGLAVLKRGGTAIDAAVAVQAMLGLVEPQSSGIGGGMFILSFDAASRKITFFNGRETAPAGATPDMFLDPATGKPLARPVAMLSGRATGVPGAIAALHAAHQAGGKLAWNSLFDDTIRTAEGGFQVSSRLAKFISGSSPQAKAEDVRAYFSMPDGRAMVAGDRLRNHAYAETLRAIATQGPDAFYRGSIARAIVERVRRGALPGSMTEADLASYKTDTDVPLCRPFRLVILCVPPPPSSGVGLLQLMAILEDADIASTGPNDPRGWYLFAEASRIMYADRDRYVGDPRFVTVPVAGLLAPEYVRTRRALIGDRAGPVPEAGVPEGAPAVGIDATQEPGGTTHFVIVDRAGNAVSITSTVESFFGSGRMAAGFFLNNQLTDFSLSPLEHGRPAANAVAGGKRPRSSMAPVLVLHPDGSLMGALGSPGGNSIPAYVGKSLIGAFVWGLPLQEAFALPNLVARGDRFDGEADAFSPEVFKGLEARGVRVRAGAGEDSGLHGVLFRNGRVEAAADPRREGVARTLR